MSEDSQDQDQKTDNIIGKLLTSVKSDTEDIVKQIETFNPNKLPPNLREANIHRECHQLGKPLNYKSLESVNNQFNLIARRTYNLSLLLPN